MSQQKRLVIFSTIALLGIITMFTISNISLQSEKKWDFNGKITKLSFSVKETPIVYINNEKYALSVGREFSEQIEVGDYLIKRKGSMVYKLVKFKTSEIFYSN